MDNIRTVDFFMLIEVRRIIRELVGDWVKKSILLLFDNAMQYSRVKGHQLKSPRIIFSKLSRILTPWDLPVTTSSAI